MLTEGIVVDLLQHMDTAQTEAIKGEQASRMRALKPSAYVREMKPNEILASSLAFTSDLSEVTVLRIAQSSVNGPTVDPSYINILSKLSLSSREGNRQHEKLVFLFLDSLTPLLYKQSPMSFVLNTLLQAKYNLLHSLPTPAAASPMEIMNLNGKNPAYMIVASMLNAGHSALKQYFEHTVVTLREINEEMAKDHPTSGIFSINACDELFNRTPTYIRPVSFNKATLTDPPHQVSPASSHSSRESRRAVAAYRQEVDIMLTPSLLQSFL
jgi:hypothetical protein